VTIRVTDRSNAPSGSASFADSATVEDVNFFVLASCQETADQSVGATCSANTSFNAMQAGTVLDAKRTILQVGKIAVSDGGADGSASTGPNYVFAGQGVFVP
jgi:hypothetical protein